MKQPQVWAANQGNVHPPSHNQFLPLDSALTSTLSALEYSSGFNTKIISGTTLTLESQAEDNPNLSHSPVN